MKRLLSAAIVAMAASGPAWAQSSTAAGTAVGAAKSTSQAISGQGGSAAITSNSTVPADQTVKNVPSVFAPGLAAAGLETCLGSVSGGGAFLGTGLSFGTSIPDSGCAARLDARTLWSMGLKKAAVARLCLNGDVYRAMPEVCGKYLPPPRPGYPAPSPLPTRYAHAEASEEQPYTGGDIWLVDGVTGKPRLCNDYDVTQQRCRVWDHVARHSTPKKKATARRETSPTSCPDAGDSSMVANLRHHAADPGGAMFLQKTSLLCRKFFAPLEVREQPSAIAELAQNRLCNDYDVTRQRCRVWAHVAHHSIAEGEW